MRCLVACWWKLSSFGPCHSQSLTVVVPYPNVLVKSLIPHQIIRKSKTKLLVKSPWSATPWQASLVSLQGQPARFVESKDRDLARKAREKARMGHGG